MEQRYKIIVLTIFMFLSKSSYSVPSPRITLSRNILYGIESFRHYYSVGGIIDSIVKNRKLAIGLYCNFNNFKQPVSHNRNYIEGLTSSILYKFNHKKLDFYIGPSITFRNVKFSYFNSSAIYKERTWGLGFHSCLTFNINRRFSIATENNFYIRDLKITEKNTSTGYYYSRSDIGTSFNKFLSFTLVINL